MSALLTKSFGVYRHSRHGKSTITLALAMAVLAATGASAQLPLGGQTGPATQTYTSAHGYSLEYPSSWQVASSSQRLQTQQGVQNLSAQTGVAMASNYDVMVYDPNSYGFKDNINVLVEPETLEVNSTTASQMETMLSHLGSRLPITVTNVQVTQTSYVGHPALLGKYNVMLSGNPLSLTQVALPDGNQTLMITCTCSESRSAIDNLTYVNMIDSIAASTPNPAPALALSNPVANFPPWLIAAICGGAVGVIVWFFGLMSQAKRESATTQGTPFPSQAPYQNQPYPNQGAYPNPGQYQNPGPYQQGPYQQPPAQPYQNPEPPQNPGPPYQ